jgi:hypothetical protein
MEAEIGKAAGALWRCLDQYGETSLKRLKQETKLSEQLLFMGLGWLAREGKLSLIKGQGSLQISLKGRN